ncbi:DEAD/DEAH box helicase family protein, partial [Caproicibacterium lactatifermentans]|uniref:DEAD/DEAH box helicase family protein n=1 Tax=Caproicibacterium lactatifermentans TaxID=2666138 RepID=UPI003D8F04FA
MAAATYGTSRYSAYALFDTLLNQRMVRVTDTIDADGKKKSVLNRKETATVQEKADMIDEQFQSWIWKDPKRRETLCSKYNRMFNSTRPREYDGSHLQFVGMNQEIKLRPHQLNAVARMLYSNRNTLLAHVVGAGKTYEMITAIMESKRLGLCKKAMVIVPNHLTEQWGEDFVTLYPGANILVASEKDFTPQKRKTMCSRIATGNYDAVIIGHSQFEKIPLSDEEQKSFIGEELEELESGLEELKNDDAPRFTVKQLEKSKKGLEARLKTLADKPQRDDVITFEELGVDRLYVDEAHNFKNLYYFTKMSNVAGISQTDAQKSSPEKAKTISLSAEKDASGTFTSGNL